MLMTYKHNVISTKKEFRTSAFKPPEYRGTHLHFAIKENSTAYNNGTWVDPEPYLHGVKTFSQNIQPAKPKVGDPLGDVLFSDIIAYIDGNAIPTSVANNKMLVVVESLASYGFDVVWDGKVRTLKVDLNKTKKITPLTVIKDTAQSGTFKCKYVYTDIKTYLSGAEVESYAIDGVTLISFELLAKYGALNWRPVAREIHLTLNYLRK